jgi:hypothetical protein
MSCDPVVWAVHDGKAGMASQVVGFEYWNYPVADDTARGGEALRAHARQRVQQQSPA